MPTISERRKALERLPSDLYDSFRGIIARIRRRPTELGMRVLMWLHFARRPLELEELQHALAVEKSHLELDTGNIPSQKVILDYCLGLVVVDMKTSIVRFTHFTVEEYFSENAETELPNGCSSIAETCLTYLNFSGLRQPCMDLSSLIKKSNNYALLNYAALYWGTYVKQQCTDSLTGLARAILEHESERPPCAIQALYSQVMFGTFVEKFSGVHATAYFGLAENMAKFSEVYPKDELGRTPLSWAAGGGHEAVVRLLVERDGVDINAEDNEGRTPLIWAAYRGHEAVVRLLIEKDDVDIDAKDNDGMTLLICAAWGGHEGVVRLLIENGGIDINDKDQEGKTPLMWAAWGRHESVVRLLIESDGVDINDKDKEGNTPLIWAVWGGHEGVVRLLIESGGADINHKGQKGKTPLMQAAWRGDEGVVRLLIESDGVDINGKDKHGKTPLMWAAWGGSEDVVRLLIERGGVDIGAKDNEGKTALSLAVAQVETSPEWDYIAEYQAVVQLLQAHGSDPSF